MLISSRLCRRPEAGLYGTKTCEACVDQRQWPGWKWKQFRGSEYRLSPSWRNLAMQVNSDIWKDEQPWKSNMWQQFWNRRSPKSQGYSLFLNFWLKTGQGMYNFSIKVCRVWSEQSSQSCSCCDRIFSGLDRWCLLSDSLRTVYIGFTLCGIANSDLKLYSEALHFKYSVALGWLLKLHYQVIKWSWEKWGLCCFSSGTNGNIF